MRTPIENKLIHRKALQSAATQHQEYHQIISSISSIMEQLHVSNTVPPTLFGNDPNGWKTKKGYGPIIVAVVVSLALLLLGLTYSTGGGSFGGGDTSLSLVGSSGTTAGDPNPPPPGFGQNCYKGGVEVYTELAQYVCCSKQHVPLQEFDQDTAACTALTTPCYYPLSSPKELFIRDGCGRIHAATYNRKCNDIVAYDQEEFAYYNCVDNNDEPYGMCTNLEVCKYNDDNAPPQ